MEKLDTKIWVDLLADSNSKIQQNLLNIVNVSLWEGTNKLQTALVEEKNLIPQ
jgi:hypothetical protein